MKCVNILTSLHLNGTHWNLSQFSSLSSLPSSQSLTSSQTNSSGMQWWDRDWSRLARKSKENGSYEDVVREDNIVYTTPAVKLLRLARPHGAAHLVRIVAAVVNTVTPCVQWFSVVLGRGNNIQSEHLFVLCTQAGMFPGSLALQAKRPTGQTREEQDISSELSLQWSRPSQTSLNRVWL